LEKNKALANAPWKAPEIRGAKQKWNMKKYDHTKY
jgi:hypothetical protein